jgi:methyl-accepting chemotaxis protein PixJ
MGKKVKSPEIKIFRNRSIATKLNIALGIASLSTLVGVILAGIVAENRIWTQVQTQAKSELVTLAKYFSPTTVTSPNLVINISDNQALQNLARQANSAALLVNKDAIITARTNSKLPKTNIGTKFDPNGLVSKAIVKGWKITSTEVPIDLGLNNGVVTYTIVPIKDQNQKILGATVLIRLGDTEASMAGISKALVGFTAIATADDLANPKLSPNFPIKLTKKALTETVVEEFKIEGQPFVIAGAPILNYEGRPIAAFISANRADPSHIFVQIVGVAVISIVVGYILALGIISAIIKSIQEMERSAQDYARGNLLAQIKVLAKDEIGTLSNLFNDMIGKIHSSETEKAGVRAQVQAQTLELEDEVGHLLDIVSDLESGNLTVQAQVTDQATGLVADTLNRLIEQLVNIMSTVLNTAQQVTQGADSLEQLATSVTQNAQLQSQSVAQATEGIENINQLAINASEEAIAANIAVESAQTAVSLGQEEITKLNNSIALLQLGTAQIVKRLKTLGEFVELAKQFVQDQKRLSSLTQVVAMNASMIAARAVEQKEPDQFASVAREFEAIASQVNNLATQTSQGLVVLQQRTGFIEIVVSGISQDIKDVTNYVTQFTTGVEQSNQAFNDIKDVTEQVASLGQTVFRSSQEIAVAVQSSVDSIQEISALAQRSASQSTLTLERSAQMGQLARRLLTDVRFFQLPADKVPQNFLVAANGNSPKKADN